MLYSRRGRRKHGIALLTMLDGSPYESGRWEREGGRGNSLFFNWRLRCIVLCFPPWPASSMDRRVHA